MTSKEIVINTLEFKNSGRAARDLWLLPWATERFGSEIVALGKEYPMDFGGVSLAFSQPPIDQGNMYEVGESVDSWGCKFINLQRGVIGEVKEPIVKDDEWEDVGNVHIPEEWLTFDVEQVNRDCRAMSDKFILAGCPRPFEQLQFIRGTENLYVDLMFRPKKMMEFIEKMHDFYCRYLTKLAQTEVDGLQFMDDWGSQNSLLINPALWKEIFRPLYRDYIDIAKKYGKKAFMHSDGYILDIIPELIDLGLDAVNSQIFCMGIENLRQFRGKITFWGEIDRQYLLAHGTPDEVRAAVRSVKENLYSDGGCIAQCEFGIGGKMENVRAVYEEWDKLTG